MKKSIYSMVERARNELISEVDANLEEEKRSLQTELDDYKFLPYVAFGINYKF